MTDKSQRAGKVFRSLKEIDRHIGRLAERLWPINTQSNNPEPQSTADQLAEIEGQAQYILPAGWQEVPLGEPLKGGDEYHAGLNRYIRQIEPEPQPDIRPIESDKTQELPTETQELEGKTQELPEYTPPEGWRVLAVGEELREGDVIVHADDAMYATARAGKVVQANQRYIRPIEPQPKPCTPCDNRDTTTTEQLADASGRDMVRGLVLQVADLIEQEEAEPQPQSELQQAADTPATEYTPPEGWRALHVGEELQQGDVRVDDSGACSAVLVTVNGVVPHGRRYIRRIEPETKGEQWANIEKQADTEYTPPEGWRVLAVGERLLDGDMAVNKNCYCFPTDRVGYFVGSNKRYIRRIEPEQQPKPEPQAADTPATEYTPPEGWRVLQAGERLRFGDMAVKKDGSCCSTERVGGWAGSYQRYIRPIEPQTEPVQVREGRWKTRNGDIRDVKPTPECDNRHDRFPWRDTAYDQTWTPNGRYQFNGEDSPLDLIRYLGPIEQQLQPEPQAAAIEELRSEVSYVQRLLGESRQRVTHLEELVGSLRTINAAQEKAFNAANKANDDLQHRLNVVSKEWAEQAATSNGLRAQLDRKDAQIRDLKIELDSLQQVLADSTPMTNNDVISRSDAVDAVVLAAVEHVVAIVARLHNTQVTPELHNTIVQAIGQLTAQLPEQHDAVIPPVVAEHCDAMPTLVQSVFYNIPDAG